jgi:predicted SAM-dependent methyltransferase
MEWTEVSELDPIRLNLGGAEYHHPAPGYEGYVSVDMEPHSQEWSVRHDLTKPIPLPDESVTRIHTEDFIEHIPADDAVSLLSECHRLLLPGGMMRIGVPDYNNPKDRSCLEKGVDKRYPGHVNLTTYDVMKDIVDRSPFARFEFYHYWDGDEFIQRPIDYSLGPILRTPDNHPKCRRTGFAQHFKGAVRDFFFQLSHGFNAPPAELLSRKGKRLHITSIVVDLFRD